MKVSKLIKELQKFNPEAEVILQKDGEGNGYSPLSGADDEAIYVPESTWCGSVYSTEWSASDAGMEEEEWEEFLKQKTCVVLYPIN